MQYLLTEDEYRKLLDNKIHRTKEQNDVLQALCTLAANQVPVPRSWDPKRLMAPWGCILTVNREHYCDECPAGDVCPCDCKNWSK